MPAQTLANETQERFVNAHIAVPLVVDLHGTLTPTDTLAESVIKLVKQSPLNVLLFPLWLLRGGAAFKRAIAARLKLPAESLPYRQDMLTFLRSEKQQGRRIILATAAHRSIADAVATHLDVFDAVVATDEAHNLKGWHKLRAIEDKVGGDFVYVGDSRADIPVWKAAKGAVLVAASPGVAENVRRATPVELEIAREGIGIGTWIRALRLHHGSRTCCCSCPCLRRFHSWIWTRWLP